MFVVSLINGISLVVVPFVLRLTSGARPEDIGLTTTNLGRDLRLGALAFLVVTPLVIAINAVAQPVWRLFREPNPHPLEEMLREGVSPGGIVLASVSAALLAPLAEELIFRGVIQGWLRRTMIGMPDPDEDPANPRDAGAVDSPGALHGRCPRATRPRWLPRFTRVLATGTPAPPGASRAPQGDRIKFGPSAHCRAERTNRRALPIILSSVFFAAVHFEQMPAPLAIFPLSLALGLLYETTGSLVPSIVLHALFNGFNTALLLLTLLSPSPIHDGMKSHAERNVEPMKRVEKVPFLLAHRDAVVSLKVANTSSGRTSRGGGSGRERSR
jgi:membrane protease YdiL (CAAX protease family)